MGSQDHHFMVYRGKVEPDTSLHRWRLSADQGARLKLREDLDRRSWRLRYLAVLDEPKRQLYQNTLRTVDQRRTPILTWPE